MTTGGLARTTGTNGPREPVLRIFLDANIWISSVVGQRGQERPTVVMQVLRFISSMRAGRLPLQLVLSHDLLDTIDRVLGRLGFESERIDAFVRAVVDLAAAGPQRLGPDMVLGGRDELAMHDREDAGILAACIAARVDLLITDNLRDFETKAAQRLNTGEIQLRDKIRRGLFTLIHERADGVAVVVMHPADALLWLQDGERPTPEAVRRRYGSSP